MATFNTSKCPYTYLKRILAHHFELTASALTWAIFLLTEHPEWQYWLWQESNELFANRIGTDELPYTEALLKETLRLFPPWWLISRRNTEPIQLADYHIPARSHLYISAYGMHRNIYYWIQPRKFDPTRFLNSQRFEPYTYLPFGIPDNGCPFQQQIWRQLTHMLTYLLYHFEFHSLNYHRYRLDGHYGLSLSPGYKVKLSSRT